MPEQLTVQGKDLAGIFVDEQRTVDIGDARGDESIQSNVGMGPSITESHMSCIGLYPAPGHPPKRNHMGAIRNSTACNRNMKQEGLDRGNLHKSRERRP